MTKQRFMPELADEQDRLSYMSEQSVKAEVTDYRVQLTPEELDQRREQFTNNSIYLKEEADKFNEKKLEYKELIKPKATENEQLLDEIVTQQRKKNGTLYHIPNHEDNTMVTYDQQGEWVAERRLKPEEKIQSRMFFTKKAVNQ